ncbi:MAG: phage major capsid protein [Tissierellia bacterium]|nr:phage major capsid protein [Tissierellia bacterium]
MNKKKYLELRNKLINAAQELINKGKLEEAEAKRKEIEKLDADFEKASKEQANLNALNKKNEVLNMGNETLNPKNVKAVERTVEVNNGIKYEDVFAKVALKRELTNEEIAVFNKFNPTNTYVHSTTNTEVVIPTTTIAGIMKKAEEQHPIFRDTKKMNIKGYVRFVKHKSIKAGDAKYYDEDTQTEAEENEFGELVLKGHELSKAVTVTWKLQAMAINEFIPFLESELGERIGAVAGDAVVNGDGTTKPQGIITALNAYNTKSQVLDTKPLDYATLTEAISKIASKYVKGCKIYANNTTIWTKLANIMDKNGRPIFVADPITGGVGRIFGMVVESEDALADDEVIIGNVLDGYVINTSEPMKLVTEQHARARKTDFVGYLVHDGGVLDEEAFAYIKATGVGA